jgi:Polymerase beta, Nucleotidyltransferase
VSPPDSSWQEELQDLLNTVDYVFPNAVRAVYLHGSRTEGSALADSDVDLSVVVRSNTDMAQVGRMIGRRTLSNRVRLDANVDTLEMLTYPAWAFLAARIKLSGGPIRGDDVRDQISLPSYKNFKAVVFEQVCKGIGMLRDLDLTGLKRMPRPVGYPDPLREFRGYEIVRKGDWYPSSTATGTKELVAVATYCASAWVVNREQSYVLSKTQAIDAIRRLENGERAHLAERLYALCRVKSQGRIPEEPGDREELRALCDRFLGFENEILSICEA